MIATQTHGLVHRPRRDHVEANAGLEPRNEEGACLVQTIQSPEVQVAAIAGIMTFWIHRNLVKRCHLVSIPLVEAGEIQLSLSASLVTYRLQLFFEALELTVKKAHGNFAHKAADIDLHVRRKPLVTGLRWQLRGKRNFESLFLGKAYGPRPHGSLLGQAAVVDVLTGGKPARFPVRGERLSATPVTLGPEPEPPAKASLPATAGMMRRHLQNLLSEMDWIGVRQLGKGD
jgi:hypothetical protein